MGIEPSLERELTSSGDTALLDELRAEEKKKRSENLPKPDVAQIINGYETEKTRLNDWRIQALRERERRNLRDTNPLNISIDMADGRRFFSKATDNEIARAVALHTQNPPKAVVPAAGNKATARKNAQTETRWSNQVLPTCERISVNPIRRRVVDCQYEIGRTAYELFLTDSYDDLDMDAQVIEDPKTGQPRLETDAEINARIDGEIQSRRPPFGIRYVDGLALYYRTDDRGISKAWIVEYKAYADVDEALARKGQSLADFGVPEPGAEGWPEETALPVPACLTIRYYDRQWYAYIVDGVAVDGVREHNLPGVPVFPVLGMVTGSPDAQYAAHGICWGMESIELGIDDLMTIALDNARTYRKPKFFVETAMGGEILKDPQTQQPVVLDLSDPNHVYQGQPGQRLVNALAGWNPYEQQNLVGQLQQMWVRNGLNPVVQGESPGAATAGYTVNALQGSSTKMFEDNIENEAMAIARLLDFARLTVRDTIQERTFLAAPMKDAKDGVEWLGLAPDQVSSVPCIVTIDPTSEANRLAKRQSLMQGNKEGFIKRERVQTEGFAIDDPEAEDDAMLIEQGEQQLAQFAFQAALVKVRGMEQPAAAPGGSGLVDQFGQPMQSAGGPPQPNAPSVGAGLAAASQAGGINGFETRPGPPALQPRTALAGQGRAIVPGPGQPGRP